MTTVIVAEKPSVARDIAAVLGVRGKGDGYLHGNGYQITWALGHLVHFAEPDEYEASWAGRWSMAQLPMIPQRWRLRTDPKTVKQYKAVKALLTNSDTERIVCATDAGREGELIFRLIAEHAHCRRPVQRLWISSLTADAIRAGLQALRPGSDYDALAAAARARAQADWLVGMNLTRAYTVHNGVLCTIGRVQTPTLAMIVERDAIIANFSKVFFYELVAHLGEGFDARYSKDGETRIDRKEQAERLQRDIGRAIEPERTGRVTSVDKKIRNNRPSPLYDLTNLQRDANRRFGFTAAKVLQLAQALYEQHKLISYPRTESRHIGEDMVSQLPNILANLDHPLAAEAKARLDAGHRLGKAYVDKTKLTDHHAILPTAKPPPAGLPEPLRKVYDLVVTRFVAVFLPDQRVEETRVTLDIGGEVFVASGSVELEPGWKRVDARRQTVAAGAATEGAAAVDLPRALPPLQKGQSVHVEGLEVVEKETQPPRPFNDATLLNAMKHAGRDIDDDTLAAAMRSSGLGTPATRAEIIEKLLRAGYIERQRKQLRATDKGRALIGLVAEPLRSVETTANWEQRLKDIERGAADAGAFYRDICALIGGLIQQVGQGPAMTPEQAAAAKAGSAGRGRSPRRHGKDPARRSAPKASGLGRCPACAQGEIVETDKAFGCSRWREGCGFTIWKTIAGKRLPSTALRQLIEQGYTDAMGGFRTKAGKAFRARLRLGRAGKVALDFDSEQRAAPGDGNNSTPTRPDDGNSSASNQAPPTSQGGASASDAADPHTSVAMTEQAASAQSLRQRPLPCPKCGVGHLIEGRQAFGCSRWRDGCDFVIAKQHHGRTLTDRELRARVYQLSTKPSDPPQ
jgi:DNA topoisomerase-3